MCCQHLAEARSLACLATRAVTNWFMSPAHFCLPRPVPHSFPTRANVKCNAQRSRQIDLNCSCSKKEIILLYRVPKASVGGGVGGWEKGKKGAGNLIWFDVFQQKLGEGETN